MRDSALWQIEGQGAHLECGPLQGYAACLDELGLVLSKWNGAALPSIAVLSSAGPHERSESLELDELYLRGEDFVGTYKPTGRHRIVPQAYWRADWIAKRQAVRIELALSVRTELLDSAPTWTVETYFGNSDLFHADSIERTDFVKITGERFAYRAVDSIEHLFLFRHRQANLSYAEMVHPSDFVSAETNPAGHEPFCVESTLFPERLEKGVIRRGRICGWFMPTENDLESAIELAREFVNEPPPLTA